jgi:hypothetical protein
VAVVIVNKWPLRFNSSTKNKGKKIKEGEKTKLRQKQQPGTIGKVNFSTRWVMTTLTLSRTWVSQLCAQCWFRQREKFSR